jgi:hypothetical protein
MRKAGEGLKARGLPLPRSRVKPWILSSFVALPACESPAAGLPSSMHIAEDAIKAGKKVAGSKPWRAVG